MRIQKISLKQYKEFLDLTIDLGNDPKRIVALVGPNGCGKSSVFDAMLHKNNRHMRVGDGKSREEKYHCLDQVPKYMDNNIGINFVEGDFEQVWIQKEIVNFQNTFFIQKLL